ncbi:hypothetical protein GCM10022233_05970 [Streptomyces shaanxiensis]|uniref:Uncharacterized protein n=1 Tax=Streptomyces shaanxiensis TaxID=653357 RepID=A0ABP7UCA1_9ACTN
MRSRERTDKSGGARLIVPAGDRPGMAWCGSAAGSAWPCGGGASWTVSTLAVMQCCMPGSAQALLSAPCVPVGLAEESCGAVADEDVMPGRACPECVDCAVCRAGGVIAAVSWCTRTTSTASRATTAPRVQRTSLR